MSRLLPLLVLLSACSGSDRDAQTRASYRSLHTWLDTWLEARQCVVGSAPDTLAGVTIGKLIGRDCSRLLHQLELPVVTDDAALDRAWSGAIDRFKRTADAESLTTRANGIDETDAAARALGLAVGRWIPGMTKGEPVPLLPDPAPMFGGVDVLDLHFNGGFPYAYQVPPEGANTTAIGVDRLGNRLAYHQSIDSRRPFAFAEVVTASQALLVWTRGDAPFAYAIDVKPKGGVARTTYVPGKLRYHAQHPQTGQIVMHVEHDHEYFIHRIEPGSITPRVSPGQQLGEYRYNARCMHDGELWGLAGEVAVHVTEKEHWPKLVYEISKDMTLDCRADAALALRHHPDVLERCGEGGCEEVFSAPIDRPGSAALLDDGRWLYASLLEGIVALWIEGSDAPALYRVKGHHQLAAITVDRGEPLLAFRSGSRYWSVGVPKVPVFSSVAVRNQSTTQP